MATLAAQQVGITGPTISFVAAAPGGDNCLPDPRAYLHVKNGSGGSINVTVDVPRLMYGQALIDPVIAVPAGQERLIGPLGDYLLWNAFAVIAWTYSAVTSVTVALVRI